MGSNRRMDHMTWPEFKEAKTRPVIVPIGSTEQHGQHLPIGTDAVLATRVAEDLAERIDGTVLPTPRIQLVSATAGFGSACFDCSLAISSSHTSLGVLYPRSFMGVSLISPTIASSSSCVRSSKLVPLGR